MSDEINDVPEEPVEDWKKLRPEERLTPGFDAKVVLLGFGVVLLILMLYVWVNGKQKLRANYKWVTAGYVKIPSDSATVERGRHVEATRGCGDCHGASLEGKVFMDNWAVRLVAPNLTPGAGSATDHYFDDDWLRAIKHGIGPDGYPLVGMPSRDYYGLSDSDVICLIAYLRNLPPVDHRMPPRRVNFISYIGLAIGKLPPIAANDMDHSQVSVGVVKPDSTATYGQYISTVCAGCHGGNFKGGAGPNLTASGDLGKWDYEQFEMALRHGTLPGGRTLRQEMPWKAFSSMTDTELKALYAWFRSLK